MGKVVNKLELENEAKQFLNTLEPNQNGATVVFLRGNLGAGKTAFSQLIGQNLGVTENLVSPTYVILKSYQLPTGQKWQTLVHLDLYRLDNSHDAKILNLDNLVADKNNLILVEWPDQLPDWKVVSQATVELEFINETKRQINIIHGS